MQMWYTVQTQAEKNTRWNKVLSIHRREESPNLQLYKKKYNLIIFAWYLLLSGNNDVITEFNNKKYWSFISSISQYK